MEYYIFDFDGVIGNSRKLTFHIHNKISDKYGLDKVYSSDDYLNIVDNQIYYLLLLLYIYHIFQ